jgi:hypothetical protein
MENEYSLKELEEDEQYIPYLYLERAKWIKYKKYGREYARLNGYIRQAKILKWRAKFILNKRNRKLGYVYSYEMYYWANQRWRRKPPDGL